ncbi:MAG: TolC family protein, partial [Pseudomonadota bacterium]
MQLLTRPILKYLFITSISIIISSCSLGPNVITPQQRSERIHKDFHAMFSRQEAIKGSLNIYQAMARAIKYNLDIRVKSMEEAFSLVGVKYARATMLPSIVGTAGYTTRDNSFSVLSPTNPGVISTTEDRTQREANLQFSWNVLDFGISYVESKQKADLYLISQERKRKIIQQVIRDTRYAYWRAWAAQQLLGEVKPFRNEIRLAIRQSEKASDEKLISPAQAAYYRAELWQTYGEMSTLEAQLIKAKPELMAMINARPNSKVTLKQPLLSNSPLPKGFPKRTTELQTMALHDRPELREEDYRYRISLNEINKAWGKMFPNISINSGLNYDSNSFLVNNTWSDFGAQLAWDILRIYTKYQGVKVAKAESDVAVLRRMALSMAIITQVKIAELRYNQAVTDLKIARNLKENRYQYFYHVNNEQKANLTDELTMINAKARWYLAKLIYYLAYAEWRNAGGQLLDSVGYDPLYSITSLNVSVNTLSRQIKRSL